MTTNISKSSVAVSNAPKGKQGVTWDEADFTWDEGINSTWDAVGAVVTGNIAKSSTVISSVPKTI